MSTTKIKRQPVPDGVTLPPNTAYVGMGRSELEAATEGLWCRQSTGEWWGPDDCIFVGRSENCHYALPLDSDFLAPEEFTLKLPVTRTKYLILLNNQRRDEWMRATVMAGLVIVFALVTAWAYLTALYSNAAMFYVIGATISAGTMAGCVFRAVECVLAAREIGRDIEIVEREVRL
jgi:hypothetical protein